MELSRLRCIKYQFTYKNQKKRMYRTVELTQNNLIYSQIFRTCIDLQLESILQPADSQEIFVIIVPTYIDRTVVDDGSSNLLYYGCLISSGCLTEK